MNQAATFQELLNSLPDDQKTEDVIQKLRFWYESELDILNRYASKAKAPSMALLPFTRSGSQYIANFWVNDLSRPKEEKYNWHLQNTSQWLYAGCILVQNGRVSTHH